METIALFFVFAAAAFYIYRQMAGAVKTDRPACGCGGGCKGCSAAPETGPRSGHLKREAPSDENDR